MIPTKLTSEEIARLNQISREKRRLENKRARTLRLAKLAVEDADDESLDAIIKFLTTYHKTPE